MGYYIVQGLKMWGVFVLFAVISTVFMGVFSFAADSGMGTNIYSCITALLFLSRIYSVAWENGKKDGRKTAAHPYKPINGVLFGIAAIVPSIIVMAVYEFFGAYEMSDFLYKMYLAAYLGFVDGFSKVPVYASLLIYATVPIASGIGYVMGKRKFSFVETYLPKLVYKQKKD